MFSNHEKDIISILGRKKMKISELTISFYNETTIPYNGQNYIASVVRSVVRKSNYHDLKWTIEGKGSGRGGRTVWRAKR